LKPLRGDLARINRHLKKRREVGRYSARPRSAAINQNHGEDLNSIRQLR
jgi:hypothetical protein